MMRMKLKPYGRIIAAALTAAALLGLLIALSSTLDTRAGTRRAELLLTSLKKAALTCYSIEGSYPESLQYIIDNYGVIVDTDSFIVSYEAFASNLMPDIRVIPKGGSR